MLTHAEIAPCTSPPNNVPARSTRARRVNLIGEHTRLQRLGFVLPAAIDFATVKSAISRARTAAS